MSKIIGKIFILLFVFVAGYLFASQRFVYGDTWVLMEPIEIMAGKEKGLLPKGAELHYQSMAHGEVDFYVFVRVPIEKAKKKTSKVEADTRNGITRLRSN